MHHPAVRRFFISLAIMAPIFVLAALMAPILGTDLVVFATVMVWGAVGLAIRLYWL